ncbi:N-acetyl-gamma-glutamyl-phosphate reductase [Microbacteriaceae bacterium SG_E_30_P1]|uniref:N-acetyl-gamma-glutamyl-phosphate reductase n=1 Tax=Antiquaquibacter oligotrophicus TaxID=2880260 RepID=A0ABT6KNQ7_9MICO|nr:N-acetyl-gamma-glutamyl-phosphate reductase [Antiquaquibacter oligotrophicus]MDH6180717.1 N-acetyl-gamma-glutamyl-phosphate reductase [Antiquaquibacter oligotrophicus]UDF13557.1 N-acetyl-gamma-glutamyl-phosphate reductase [Antiquaquibacter oligotrophicus]
MTYSVAVAGASGYAGGEILRLLASHPELEVTTVTAHQNAGEKLGSVQPHLRSLAGLTLAPTTPDVLEGHDVVFVALPHGKSGELTEGLGDGTLVVDCGADHRLTSPEAWDRFYGGEYFGAWDYGMPELLHADGSSQRDILRQSRRIAVPGCNVTAITLGLAPGIRSGVISAQDIVSVLAVGPSGAGKALRTDLLASEILGSSSAYGVGGVHRHTPEIVQNLEVAGGDGPTISFTPMLVPMSRGILATSTARLAPGATAHSVRDAWSSAYDDEPFVHLLPEGQYPRTADTVGANTCLMGIAIDETAGRVVVVSALDNLVKGTAGAAIQSANIALGIPESAGLTTNGVAP